MKQPYFFILLCAGSISWAQAEIYKSVDAEGRVTYSSTPSRGARKLNLDRLRTVPAPARNNATPLDFPRIDSSTQKSRDHTRRKILGDELAAEEQLLTEARASLKYEVENPPYDKDGASLRYDAKREEKINGLQQQVTLHEKNIEALRTELLKTQ